MKKTVEVVFHVDVEMDEQKFTPAFMAEFSEAISADIDSIDEHAKHIAQMAARGVLSDKFTEGYGPLTDMGISARVMMIEEPRIVEV